MQQLAPSLDNNQLQGALGSAIAAVLSSDLGLRQTLLRGACLFALAAGKVDYGKNAEGHAILEQNQSRLEGQETQAEEILALVQGSITKVINEVSCLSSAPACCESCKRGTFQRRSQQ